MANLSAILYVTYVEKEGAFIKIWGQSDRNISIGIEKALQQLTPRFENGEFLPNFESLYYGALCCAKFKDGNYYRARILNTNFLPQGLVEVVFIDYGNKEMLHFSNVRLMNSLPVTLSNIPPQAKHHILANVTHPQTGWNDHNFNLIVNDVRYLEYHLLILTHIGPYPLIKLIRNNEDLALNLVSRGLAVTISTQMQIVNIQDYLTNLTLPHPKPVATVNTNQQNTPSILAYKTMPLDPDTEHEVFISYVSDGPCLFSVQLKKMEDTLKKLMTEINSVVLISLDENPLPGTVCLARSAEDGYICRAVITNMVDDQYKVFYVDFGNTEVLGFEEIYQIPFKYVIPKVMATRFTLAGLEHSAVSLEMKCAFKKFVNDKLLMLKMKPTTTRSALSLCELRDLNGENVLDIVKRAALNSYPEPVLLSRGTSQEVKVSYVCSCNKIYVQLMSKQEELRKLMISLQSSCQSLETFTVDKVKQGAPCFALFSDDKQWYRAEILNPDINNLRIRYVDFGNEEVISIFQLKIPDSNQLIMLRPQAIECCLNGYQNMEPDPKRDNILEELLLEKEFGMKVIEMQTGRAIVDLFDKSGCNVALLLIQRLRRIQQNSSIISDNNSGDVPKHSTPVIQRNRQPSNDNNNKWNKSRTENWRQKSPSESSNSNTTNNNNSKSKYRDNNFKSNRNHSRNSSDSDNSKRYVKSHPKKYESERSLSDTSEKNYKSSSPRSDKSQSSFTKSKPRNNFNNKKKYDSHNKSYDYNSKSYNSNAKSYDSDAKSYDFKARSNDYYNTKSNDYDSKTFDYRAKSNERDKSFETDKHVEYAASNEAYPFIELSGQTEKVSITWFHNPLFFYCKLQKYTSEFCKLMEDIQNAYFKRQPTTATTGSPVVALFPEDGVLYRAIVLEDNNPSYRVQYVDFGNIAMVDKIWPLEKRFIKLPAQAIHCALSSIKCKEDKWPQPDVFSSYFDKDTFDCTFVSKDLNKYFIELSSSGLNINEELIKANLADPLLEDVIDLSLLIGQQLRVTVTSVLHLSQFTVTFEDCSPKCSAHNLEAATQTYLDVLKGLINKPVIIYVDDVQENVLFVTIYNENGSKVVILEPDEGAYDNVEQLCALPVFTSTISGFVSHAMPDGICLQPAKYADTITWLLNEMYDHYNELSEENVTPEEGEVYAVLSEDGNWYRGRAIKIEDEEIQIIYIDYGNDEIVKPSQLRKLAENFLKCHMFAIKITVKDATSYLDQNISIKLIYSDNGWEGEVLNANKEQLFDSPAIKFTEKQLLPEVGDTEEKLEAVITSDQDICRRLSVTLSHADSPSDFYLQLQEDEDIIFNLQCSLQEQIPVLDALENPGAGVLCAALYSVDQQWYRAQILDYDNDIITVRFVDFGNTDVLDNNNMMIKTLPIEMITLTQYARRCSLVIKPIDTEWSAAAFERFTCLANANSDLKVEVIDQNEKITYLSLYANDVDVAECLINEGHAIKLDLDLEATCTGFISHLNSPSEFYIQLESAVGDLEWTADQLSLAGDFAEIQDLTPGALCAAVYPEDEMWYRARILSNTVAGLEVLFIDYGNSCTCTNLKELPEELIMLPPLAQKCSLDKPPGILQWSPQSIEKFKEISADGASIFTVKKIKPGETTVVQLSLNGEDITKHLMPILEKGRVNQINALDKIYVVRDEEQFKVMEEKLEQLERKLITEYVPDEMVACKYEERLARSKVLSKSENGYEVELVDCGTTILVNEIYQLPDDVREKQLVSVYKLDSLPGVQFTEESFVKLKEIFKEANGIFNIEFISSNVLRLYLDGADIRSQLGGIKLSPISSVHSTPKKIPRELIKEENTIIHSDIELNDEKILLVSNKSHDEPVEEQIPNLSFSDEETPIKEDNSIVDSKDNSYSENEKEDNSNMENDKKDLQLQADDVVANLQCSLQQQIKQDESIIDGKDNSYSENEKADNSNVVANIQCNLQEQIKQDDSIIDSKENSFSDNENEDNSSLENRKENLQLQADEDVVANIHHNLQEQIKQDDSITGSKGDSYSENEKEDNSNLENDKEDLQLQENKDVISNLQSSLQQQIKQDDSIIDSKENSYSYNEKENNLNLEIETNDLTLQHQINENENKNQGTEVNVETQTEINLKLDKDLNAHWEVKENSNLKIEKEKEATAVCSNEMNYIVDKVFTKISDLNTSEELSDKGLEANISKIEMIQKIQEIVEDEAKDESVQKTESKIKEEAKDKVETKPINDETLLTSD